MERRQITQGTTAYIFDDIPEYSTCTFLIEKKHKIFIIDTFCGPEPMKSILKSLKFKSLKKEIIVINTHFHWDHVWGNCSFRDNFIVSHELCRKLMDENWESQISENSRYLMGEVEKSLPDITFKDNLFFHSDSIELFYSPGHTEDCISVFDHEEKTLFVGDNLEKPIIYVENAELNRYIRTLENYLAYNPKKIAASHTVELNINDIFKTIDNL